MNEPGNHKTLWPILGSVCLMAFSSWIPTYCIPPMEHILKEELLLTHAQTSLLFTGPIIMLAALSVLGGLLADKIGPKKAIGIGAIIMVIGSTLRSTVTSASSLLVFTFIYGAGTGLSYANLPKMLGGWVSREKIGMAVGMYTAGMFAGEALAVAITIPLIFPITNSFQGVFLIWSTPLIAATIAWWVIVKDPPQLHNGNQIVSRVRNPLRLALYNQNLWIIAGVLLIVLLFYNVWVGWSPAILMLKGATPDLAGLMTSITIWVGIPAALLIPRLSYRLGLRKPFIWAGAITLAISAWIAIKVSLPLSWPLMVIVGLALNSMMPILYAIPSEIIPREAVGSATGLVISFGNIGAVIGPYIGGRILDISGNLDLSLIILVAVSVAAAAIAFKLPETAHISRNKM